MKLSMGAWSFAFGPYAANPKSLEEISERLAKAGYDGIELSGWPPHVTLESYPSSESRARLRRYLADLGLGVSSFSADLATANPLMPSHRQDYLDRFARLVELCADVGSPSIRVDSVGAPGSIPDSDYQGSLMRLADLWRDCADIGREAQVAMVWEFEPGFLFNKPSEVLKLHDKVGHPWFQILFDTAHAYMASVVGARQQGQPEVLAGGVAELLSMLHGAIGAIHLIDSDGTLLCDETSTHVPIGQGLIPWETLTPKLLGVQHVEWWCLDLCFFEGAWAMVEDNLRRAKKLLAKCGVVQ